jgi:hypothetical protein
VSAVDEAARMLGYPMVVLPDGASDSMESAIRFLVNQLTEAKAVPADAADDLVKALLRREYRREGPGAPAVLSHLLTSTVDRAVGIVARCPRAVPCRCPGRYGLRQRRSPEPLPPAWGACSGLLGGRFTFGQEVAALIETAAKDQRLTIYP